jgi:hypothetical protein
VKQSTPKKKAGNGPTTTTSSKVTNTEGSVNHSNSDSPAVQEPDLWEQYHQALTELVDAREAKPRDPVRIQAAKERYNKISVVYLRNLKEEAKRRAKANGISLREQRRLDVMAAGERARARLKELRERRAK